MSNKRHKKNKVYMYCQECGEKVLMRRFRGTCDVCGGSSFSTRRVEKPFKSVLSKDEKKRLSNLLKVIE